MTPSRFTAVFLSGLLMVAATAFATDVQDINQQFRKGDLTGALQRANAYLAKNPKDAQARFLKGLILADQGKSSEAIQVFTSLTEDYPELPEPYNNLAVLYAAQNKYDAAKNALEMAIRTHPSYATAHENLGDIYAKMASMAYDKALQLDNSNPTAQTKLALIKEIVSGQPRRTVPAKAGNNNVVNVAKAPVVAKAATRATSSPAPIAETSAPEAAVQDQAIAWANAWSKRDVDAYLGFYASDFATPDGMSRTEWEAQRRERITKPSRISVTLSNFQAKASAPDRVEVSFKQAYQSNLLRSTSTKVLEMVLRDGKWLIVREGSR